MSKEKGESENENEVSKYPLLDLNISCHVINDIL